MGAKEINYWGQTSTYANDIYEFERYLDIADIGANTILRNAKMASDDSTILHPLIFGEGTPSTIFSNSRWNE